MQRKIKDQIGRLIRFDYYTFQLYNSNNHKQGWDGTKRHQIEIGAKREIGYCFNRREGKLKNGMKRES